MGRSKQALAKLEVLMQGENESPMAYGERACRLFLLVDEEDEHWVVENFIEGIDSSGDGFVLGCESASDCGAGGSGSGR